MPIEDDDQIRAILRSCKTIAVVGASPKPYRDSNSIADFLIRKGYTVHPVNPSYDTTNGRTCFPDLSSVPEPIDIVDIFRRSEAVGEVVDQAIAVRAKVVWMQTGIINEAAAAKAEAAGLNVIMDHCIAVDHRRLIV